MAEALEATFDYFIGIWGTRIHNWLLYWWLRHSNPQLTNLLVAEALEATFDYFIGGWNSAELNMSKPQLTNLLLTEALEALIH